MAKCGNCNAVINPRWESCLVCDSPVNATITVEPEKEQKAEKLDRELEQDAIPIKDKGEQIISLHTKIDQMLPLSPEADCFDPDGALASLLECAERKGISDAQVASIVDDLIRAQSLKSPWGIKIKGSPALGDYWIVSDEEAKKLIPTHEVIFAQDDIRLLAEVREIFGIKSVEVKKYDTGKQAGI